jgi:hypothetical protein
MNVSSTACLIDGAPTVFALDRHGVALAEAHGDSGDLSPHEPVVLQHHDIAAASLVGSSHPSDGMPDSVCQTYPTLLVTMPGNPRSARARVSAGGSDAAYTMSSCGGLGTEPVVALPSAPTVPYTPPPFVAF